MSCSTLLFWQKLYSADDPGPFFHIIQTLGFAESYLPLLVNLLTQDYVKEAASDPESLPVELRGMGLFRIILPEEGAQHSSPDRIIQALSGVNEIYGALETVDSRESNTLIILACDSGSDKSFEFLGVAKSISSLKEIILQLWDRIVFFKQAQMNADIQVIGNALLIIMSLKEMRDSGSLEPELAEQIKRKILSGLTKITSSGVVTPEMDAQERLSPRTLMRPEQRLLAAPPTAVPQSSIPPQSQNGESRAGESIPTKADIDAMRRLLSTYDPPEEVGESKPKSRGPRRNKD